MHENFYDSKPQKIQEIPETQEIKESYHRDDLLFTLQPSYGLILYCCSIFGISCVLIFSVDIPLVLQGLLIYALSIFLLTRIKQEGTRTSKKAITYIRKLKKNWILETRQGYTLKAKLLRDSYRSHFFLILRFQTKTKNISITIPFDALSRSEYRLLYAQLLFETSPNFKIKN